MEAIVYKPFTTIFRNPNIYCDKKKVWYGCIKLSFLHKDGQTKLVTGSFNYDYPRKRKPKYK